MVDTHPKAIYIIGPSCTGKTTLLNALLEYYAQAEDSKLSTRPLAAIREVARSVMREQDFDRSDITSSADRSLKFQKAILQAQYKAETVLKSETWYISDRSGIDPVVYARSFIGEEAAEELLVSPEWTELEHRMRASLVFLCEAGGDWLADDGTRLMPKDLEAWVRFDHAYRQLLRERKIEYHLIPKDFTKTAARVTLVTTAYQQLLDSMYTCG